MANSAELTSQVLAMARQVGFIAAGVAGAGEVPGAAAYRAWLADGCGDGMDYLQRNLTKRFHPSQLVSGARSVLCLAVGYAPAEDHADDDPDSPGERAFIARYARGRDYHKVLKRRCLRLMDELRKVYPALDGRAFVDSAPLAERSLAAAAGLGCIGRNGCLIVPGWGSYVLLCEIVSNLPLTPGTPARGGCGECRMCLDACPSAACRAGLVDARRCLSCVTIEQAGAVAPELRPAWGRRVFGCDTCQQVCPHNRQLPPGDRELIAPLPSPALASATLAELLAWDKADWDVGTRGSAARRAPLERILRNAVLAAGASGQPELRGPLLKVARGRSELSELVDWSLGRLEYAAAR